VRLGELHDCVNGGRRRGLSRGVKKTPKRMSWRQNPNISTCISTKNIFGTHFAFHSVRGAMPLRNGWEA
jgi:hypothetical protein